MKKIVFVTSLVLFVLFSFIFIQTVNAGPKPSSYSNNYETTNFIFYYNTTGRDATTQEYVKNVGDTFEHSYNKMVTVYGFKQPPFSQKFPVYLKLGDSFWGADMFPSKYNPYGYFNTKIDSSIEVNSVIAHESFHLIQANYDQQEGPWIKEGTAHWASYAVYPEGKFWANKGTEWLFDPDFKAIEYRDYSPGVFWIWLSQHYGNDVIKKVLENTLDYEGFYAVANAVGKPFDDIFEEFTIALYTRNFTDKNVSSFLYSHENVKRYSILPRTVRDVIWNGETILIDKVGNEIGYTDTAKKAGDKLQVRHAYGMDYIKIKSSVANDLQISFDGNLSTEFRANVITNKMSEFKTYHLTKNTKNSPVVIKQPNSYDEIFVVVTRGEAGTGYYTLTLSKPGVVKEVISQPTTSLNTSSANISQEREYEVKSRTFPSNIIDWIIAFFSSLFVKK